MMKEFNNIPAACETFMRPARKILEEHGRNSRAREQQSLAPARIADSLEKTGEPGISPQSLREIAYSPVNHVRQILCQESALIAPRQSTSMDLSSIQTMIIQAAGRYCDRFASDVLVGLAMLAPFEACQMNDLPDTGQPNEWLIVMGLREDGCDGHDAVLYQLRQSKRGTPYVYPSPYYRKLYGVWQAEVSARQQI